MGVLSRLLNFFAPHSTQPTSHQSSRKLHNPIETHNASEDKNIDNSPSLVEIDESLIARKLYFDAQYMALNKFDEKAHAFIRDKFNEKFSQDKDVRAVQDFLSETSDLLSGEAFPAKIEGIPVYELADQFKHNLSVMMYCCKKEIENMAKTGTVAAPAPFRRVAILSKKEKNFTLEIVICEVLLASYRVYSDAYRRQKKASPLNMSGIVEEMEKRITSARKNIEKQQTGKAKQGKK